MRELTGRRGIRDDVSQYEAVGMGMVDMQRSSRGGLLASFPDAHSPLRFERFFDTLYLRYDERYVYSAEDLSRVTRRLEWSPDSPALREMASSIDYAPRTTS